MKRILAGLALFLSTQALGVEWFSHGLRPVDTGTLVHEDLSAESCRDCHAKIYDEWKSARHSQAWTNSLFHEGFLLESQDRCIFCHAPMKEQFAEIKEKSAAHLSHEGVNCITCHVRDSEIHSASSSGLQFHPWKKDQRLKKAEFCAGCHQFNFNKTVDGHAILTPLTVQNTYNEWLAYREKGGRETCQSCHMPGGKHTFQGAHTPEVLARGIDFHVAPGIHGYAFILRVRNVGHRVPTGDLFRHLTLEVAKEGGPFEAIARIGRTYGFSIDDKTGEAVQGLVEDTSLGPFERRVVNFSSDRPVRYRLVYHYTSPRDELKSLLKPDELKTIVASGTTPALPLPKGSGAVTQARSPR
jgi:hypothetical protein